MRLNRFSLLTGFVGLLLGLVIAHAQAPATPTLEQARQAVANLGAIASGGRARTMS